MSPNLTLSLDQLYRPQPGGIGTYVRGLIQGLITLADSEWRVQGLAPKGALPHDVAQLPLRVMSAPLSVGALTKLWRYWPLGVARDADIVHATSMAGPFGGGRPQAIRSVAMHDLLWRDEPNASTRSGVRFHDQRLRLIQTHEGLRVLTSSPNLKNRLIELGFAPSRIHPVRLGVDDDGIEPAPRAEVTDFLARHGVKGPFTLYAGTREPRKNLERLVAAHRQALHHSGELGPLVLAGPAGWGEVPTGDALTVGLVARSLLKGLYRDAQVFAYVPRAEGWGLPPVEALHEGTRVVASRSTPSVDRNDEVVLVDPLDVDSIAQGLLDALALDGGPEARLRRRSSVSELTWRNAALDHVAAWR